MAYETRSWSTTISIVGKKGKRPTRKQIDKESHIAKAYWAQLKNVIFEDGCPAQIRYSKNSLGTKKLLVVSRAKS